MGRSGGRSSAGRRPGWARSLAATKGWSTSLGSSSRPEHHSVREARKTLTDPYWLRRCWQRKLLSCLSGGSGSWRRRKAATMSAGLRTPSCQSSLTRSLDSWGWEQPRRPE